MAQNQPQASQVQQRKSPMISLRENLTERWVQRRLGRIGHERRVTAIATTLFDLLIDLHELTSTQRRLLRLGCIVHDVGRQVEERRHPAIGAEMIQEDTSLPVNRQDRRRLAYLTRYHRGAVPEVGYDGILRRGDGRKAMRRIIAILRAADTLDNRNIAAPRIVIARKGRKVRVTCFIESDFGKARRVFSRRKKFRLMEDLLDCKVEVQIKQAQSVQAV
jgi:exopolyphosphatase/guanosine-5'-triphosphate,3'-diphosphate pyrophosphatase